MTGKFVEAEGYPMAKKGDGYAAARRSRSTPTSKASSRDTARATRLDTEPARLGGYAVQLGGLSVAHAACHDGGNSRGHLCLRSVEETGRSTA